MSDLETLRDQTGSMLSAALSTLLERARAAGETDLVARLLYEPPEILARGYGVLPEITDDPSTRTRALAETRFSIEALLRSAKQQADAADALATARRPASNSNLEDLVTDYEAQRDHLQNLDEQLAYHAYWQDAVADYPDYFETRNQIVSLVRELKDARDRGEPQQHLAALETEARARAAPFVPTKGLAIRTKRDGTHVLPVTLLTDITDKKFLKQFRASVVQGFSRSSAARALGFEVDLEIRRIAPRELYPEGPPAKGDAIDLDAHVARFPEGAMILTTGAESTHSWQGRSILFGPVPIRRNSLAHEFGHLLGFSDAYQRGFEGAPDDPYGVVLVEWSGLFDDLMGNSEAGVVSEEMIRRLLDAYAAAQRETDR